MIDTAEQASLLLLSKLAKFLDNPTIKIESAPTDEIAILQEQIKALRAENERLQDDIKRTEQRYFDEVNRNMHLQDICKAHGLEWRRYW